MHSSDRTLLTSLGFADPDKKDRRHTLACQYLAQSEVMSRVVESIKGASAPVFEITEANAVFACKAPTPPLTTAPAETLTYKASGAAEVYGLTMAPGIIESPITKGRNDFLVGFWDVVAHGERAEPWAEVVDAYKRAPRVLRWPVAPEPINQKTAMHMHVVAHQERVATYDRERAAYEAESAAWLVAPHLFVSRAFTAGWSRVKIGVYVEVKARPVDVADIARQVALYTSADSHVSGAYVVVATCYQMSPLDRDTLKRKGIHTIRLGAPFEAWCAEQTANKPVDDGGGF